MSREATPKSDMVFKMPWLLCSELTVGEGWGWRGRYRELTSEATVTQARGWRPGSMWLEAVRFRMFPRQNQMWSVRKSEKSGLTLRLWAGAHQDRLAVTEMRKAVGVAALLACLEPHFHRTALTSSLLVAKLIGRFSASTFLVLLALMATEPFLLCSLGF